MMPEAVIIEAKRTPSAVMVGYSNILNPKIY